MADHLGFMFGYGPNGLPEFPDPFRRHDPKKTNAPKVNGDHIRNSLQGIRQNIGRGELHSYLERHLTPNQLNELTHALDNLVQDLSSQGYFYEQFGADTSEHILFVLKEMGWAIP
jgi:hypothetical protein